MLCSTSDRKITTYCLGLRQHTNTPEMRKVLRFQEHVVLEEYL